MAASFNRRTAAVRAWVSAVVVCVVGVLAACSDNTKPTIQSPGDQYATVGVEMSVLVQANDPDGDSLNFSVEVPGIPDMGSREHPARMESYGTVAAYLRWTPLASDVGSHEFIVRASDGKATAQVTFMVNVGSGNAGPVFRQPLGSGTTLDLSQQTCIDVDVVVEDPDSTQVDIYLEDPIEEGYDFQQDGPTTGTFSWCPTAKQIDSAERYTLNLAANDRDEHIARKKYVIVLRRDLGQNCPGQAPAISHTQPSAMETLYDIDLAAGVSDDQGLAGLPVLYYSLTAPTNPQDPDFSEFVQLIMDQVSGDARNGQYTGRVPNPVLNDPPGTSKTIYYFFEATDDDDDTGNCDHRTTDPASGVYQVDVTRPQGGSTLNPCDACSGDVQCGDGLCVVLGGWESYCLDTCTTPDQNCTADTVCSSSPLISVDNVSGLVCVPTSGSCEAACTDDLYEDNDAWDDPNVPELFDGQYPGLKLCGNSIDGDDEDFYKIVIPQSTFLTATLLFSHADGDIDLKLLDGNGNMLASSMSVTDDEQVTECLQTGTYYVRVFTYDWTIDAMYTLVLTAPGGRCCVDDPYEDDDDHLHAHSVVHNDLYEDMQICMDDQDWYAINLTAGQTIEVDVLFDQNIWEQDLDVYLYDTNGTTNLTPCCDPNNGQSGTSDEHLEYTVSTAGTYYVVVEGYAGSENMYMIGFTVVN